MRVRLACQPRIKQQKLYTGDRKYRSYRSFKLQHDLILPKPKKTELKDTKLT